MSISSSSSLKKTAAGAMKYETAQKMSATAVLGAGCWFTTELNGDVWMEMREVIGVEVNAAPSVIVSVGFLTIKDIK